MVLPSKDVVQDIRNLINEITGFGEDEENFYICEQYCMSHVMHHTYPSVNKNEVKKLIDGYIHRFFIHGYFKVADGLDTEVKKFLGSDLLFKKNPEFEIQWVLLSLLTGLASNLSTITKLPKMVSVSEDEKPCEEINWGEYLKEGLPAFKYLPSDEESDSDTSFYSQGSDALVECQESTQLQECVNKTPMNNVSVMKEEEPKIATFHPSRQHIIDELVKRRDEEMSCKRDIVLRGNFIEELGLSNNKKHLCEVPQILSEYEVVGYVLKQFLTGENIFKKKGITNPATCSLSGKTVKHYLTSIQPYINMITAFKEFKREVEEVENSNSRKFLTPTFNDSRTPCETDSCITFNRRNGKFSNTYSSINKINSGVRKTVPNVVKLYNLALTETLSSFESKILTMSEYQNSFTLVKVLDELRPSFNDLSALFTVHLTATANWLNQPNWLSSFRIIATLYKAILHSTSNRLGFLFMNIFLHCFQAYLDITDNWISCLSLNDPNDEYIIYRTNDEENGCDGDSKSYGVRPYEEELPKIGIKKIQIFDYLANKMIHVGHSIDILNRLDRSLIQDQNDSNSGSAHESLYKMLLNNIKDELRKLEESLPSSDDDCKRLSVFRASETEKGVTDVEVFVSQHVDDGLINLNTHNSRNYEENNNRNKDIGLSEFCTKLCQNDPNDLIEKSIWPLGLIIEANMKSLANARVVNVCDIAKDIVVNEFQLKNHLRLLRNIFLFNEPHLILSFMAALFHNENLWQNGYILTALLRECIGTKYKNQARYLSVSVEEISTPPKNILEAIDRITINYQVGWPLKLIFTPQIMTLYNNIFRHLFKFHWAHETLCKLRFYAIDRNSPDVIKSSRRRLELLRFWCLGSLARLRSYFMAQISTPFDLKINSYQHLRHIIKAHEDFIKKIHSRCLLDNDNANRKELIFNVLISLCHDISEFWSTGRVIPDSKLTVAENIFFTSQKEFPRLMAGLEEE